MAGKFIGILVVIVLGLIAVPVGILFLGSDNSENQEGIFQEDTRIIENSPTTPSGKAIEFDASSDTVSTAEKSVEKPSHELTSENIIILDDGILTYKIDQIPEKINQKEFIKEAVYDGFKMWSQENPKLVFEEITTGEPDILISWIEFQDGHIGYGCIDCLENGAKIEVVLEQTDCTDKLIQYDKGMITNTVAHEFGHNLGLQHHIDENNLMWSDEHPQIPFDTLGYNIPNLVPEYFLGYKDMQDKIVSLTKDLEELNEEIDLLTANYKQLYTLESAYRDDSGEYNTLTQAYNKLKFTINKYNTILNEINPLLDKLSCIGLDRTTYQNSRFVSIFNLQNMPQEIKIKVLSPTEAKQKEIDCEKEVDKDSSLTFAEKIVQKRNCATYGNRYGGQGK